jgi:hypothetical protein
VKHAAWQQKNGGWGEDLNFRPPVPEPGDLPKATPVLIIYAPEPAGQYSRAAPASLILGIEK